MEGNPTMRKNIAILSILATSLMSYAAVAQDEAAAPAPEAAPAAAPAPAPEMAPAPVAAVAPADKKIQVGIAFLPMVMGRQKTSGLGPSSTTGLKLAYGVGITAGYAVIPGLTVGIAPQVIFHLIGDNGSGDSATEYDLMVRIAYAYTVIPKLSVGVEVLPGYSIIAIPSSLKEGTSFDNPKGFVMAFGAGAAYDVTDMFFANVGIGYQIGFQSTSIMGTSEDIKTSFLRILVGGGVKF